MGNSTSKEPGGGRSLSRHASSERAVGIGDSQETSGQVDAPIHPIYHSRAGRSSRSDVSALFGIGGSGDQDVASLEHRRESKLEREARRAERERVSRRKERERSMRDEHVDGGYLVTQGVYTGPEDFSKTVVRQLMVTFSTC